MKLHLAILSLACMLPGCQTTQQRWEYAFYDKAAIELNLLQYSTKCATRAEVYTRLENVDTNQPKQVEHYQLTEDEFQQLKDVLSRAAAAPFGGTIPESWQQADCGIILYDAGGRQLIDLNESILNSYSKGSSLLALPDCDMGVLKAMPTLRQAKEHMSKEDAYTLHCRRRNEAADEMKQKLQSATQARILLKNNWEEKETTINLGSEEHAQLLSILSQAAPLPPMTRTAWDSPDTRGMPLPPLKVNKSLQFLNEENGVVCTLSLDYPVFAKASEAELFCQHERNGELFSLPDEQYVSFLALPFWEHIRLIEAE